MAVLDHARGTIRLSGRELAAAMLSVVDPANPSLRHPDMVEALGALGAVGGVVPAAAAEVVRVVHRPQLRVVVEVFRTEPAVVAALWATPELAVVGQPVEDDTLEYRVTDPVSVPFTLASLVGLGPGPCRAALPAAITVPAGVLDAVAEPVGRADEEGALRLLRDAGLSPGEADAVAGLVAARRATWRVSSSWMDEAGALHVQALTLVDAGEAGVWRSDAAADPDPGPATVVTLRPVTPVDVWRGLVGLLPVA